jgi:hypothetical protein
MGPYKALIATSPLGIPVILSAKRRKNVQILIEARL